jgi:hypothetical protein
MSHPCISNAEIKRAVITSAGAGDVAIKAAVTGKKIRLISAYIRQSAAGTVRFESAAGGTALSGVMVTTTADLVIDLPVNMFGHVQTAAGEGLYIEAGTAAVMGFATYQEI